MIVLSIEEFAAKRRKRQEDVEKDLFPYATRALNNLIDGLDGWEIDLTEQVEGIYSDVYRDEGGEAGTNNLAAFMAEVRSALQKTTPESSAELIATWLATAVLNAATLDAAADDPEPLVMEWVTMHDEDVRETHQVAEGQQQPVGEKFTVGGEEMRYPGDPTVSVSLWINCRCSLAPALVEQTDFSTEGEAMTVTEAEPVVGGADAAQPWHGVLAPEGVWSGDGRMFSPESLNFRDLPLPLTWQKFSDDGHKGSVVVADIQKIERRDDGLLYAEGVFLDTPEAVEVMGLIKHFGRFGVSVDADDVEVEFDDDGRMTFTSARIASASIVPIPAFAEAYVTLGLAGVEPTDEEFAEKLLDAATRALDPVELATSISEKPWDGSASRFTPEEWYRSTLIHLSSDKEKKSDHKLPILEPGGALSRAGVHAAAARVNQVDAPGDKVASAKRALRGAYAKLNEEVPDVLKASVISLVASAGYCAPSEWFQNPELKEKTHLQVTPEGRVFGHIASFDQCHGAYKICVTAPHSSTNYAWFLTGKVLLDDGTSARVGQITSGAGHAPARYSARAAAYHYDSTSAAVADVTVGEDEFGIWCAGWIRPGATDEQITALRASDISGDWRDVGAEEFELIAVLAVNSAGLPIPVYAGISNGVQTSLVAAGMVDREDEGVAAARIAQAIAPLLDARIEEHLAARAERKARMAALAARVGG